MQSPLFRFTIRRVMVAVAIVGVLLGCIDAVKVAGLARKYRHKAESLARMERRCREIDAMTREVRKARSDAMFDDPYLLDPVWNRKMIPYFAQLQSKFALAAEHPRIPIAPDPPVP